MNIQHKNHTIEEEQEILSNLESFDFYKSFIEEPLIPFIKYLRNKGINTTGSCAHEKYVVFYCTPQSHPEPAYPTIDHISDLIRNYGYTKFHFKYPESAMPILYIDQDLELESNPNLEEDLTDYLSSIEDNHHDTIYEKIKKFFMD